MTIIAKNNTGSAVLIRDLGVVIPASGQETLSDSFSEQEIQESLDLIALVTDGPPPAPGTLTLNDGTSDIPPEESEEFLKESATTAPKWNEEILTPTVPGQTSFALSKEISPDGAVFLSVNGVNYGRTTYFTASGTSLTWLDVPFALETIDELLARYQTYE